MAAMVASKRLLLISRWLRYPGCYINPAVKSSQSGCRQQNESSFFGGTGERSGRRSLSTATPLQSSEDKVKINFINRDGEKLKAEGKLCDSLLDVVIENNLDIDGFAETLFGVSMLLLALTNEHKNVSIIFGALGRTHAALIQWNHGGMRKCEGACEGTLACSTCHLIFEESIYKKLDCITDEEMDMLDLAYSLTDTSRLGCQICLKKWMDGMTVEVPSEVSDARQTQDFSSYT